jgi:hypothetical protein
MSSGLIVDNITNSVGTPLITNGDWNFSGRPGSILECLTSPCNGSTVTGISGSYTWPNVTSFQAITTSYADATGSVISYVPPTGTKKVIYEYSAFLGWADDHAISHWKLYIDGTEVLYARRNRSGRYPEDTSTLRWVFNVGTSDTNTGAQATWTETKEIKWQVRDYSGSNRRYRLHQTTYWDGAGGNQFCMPNLTITAIS